MFYDSGSETSSFNEKNDEKNYLYNFKSSIQKKVIQEKLPCIKLDNSIIFISNVYFYTDSVIIIDIFSLIKKISLTRMMDEKEIDKNEKFYTELSKHSTEFSYIVISNFLGITDRQKFYLTHNVKLVLKNLDLPLFIVLLTGNDKYVKPLPYLFNDTIRNIFKSNGIFNIRNVIVVSDKELDYKFSVNLKVSFNTVKSFLLGNEPDLKRVEVRNKIYKVSNRRKIIDFCNQQYKGLDPIFTDINNDSNDCFIICIKGMPKSGKSKLSKEFYNEWLKRSDKDKKSKFSKIDIVLIEGNNKNVIKKVEKLISNKKSVIIDGNCNIYNWFKEKDKKKELRLIEIFIYVHDMERIFNFYSHIDKSDFYDEFKFDLYKSKLEDEINKSTVNNDNYTFIRYVPFIEKNEYMFFEY